ncbi:MAG: hypothetical protein RBS21_05525 [Corynebacterium sp.]|jgi:hypothetical protein|nr:hypothetical protein [Corynebacterium sp.]
MTAPADFRIRRTPRGYRIWQREGRRKWVPGFEWYATRGEAQAAIARMVTTPGKD